MSDYRYCDLRCTENIFSKILAQYNILWYSDNKTVHKCLLLIKAYLDWLDWTLNHLNCTKDFKKSWVVENIQHLCQKSKHKLYQLLPSSGPAQAQAGWVSLILHLSNHPNRVVRNCWEKQHLLFNICRSILVELNCFWKSWKDGRQP